MQLEYRAIGNRALYETGEAVGTGLTRPFIKEFGLCLKSIAKPLESLKQDWPQQMRVLKRII